MRILLVGSNSLLDDAVSKIVHSECDAEVHRIIAEELLNGKNLDSFSSFSLSLVNMYASNSYFEAVMNELKKDGNYGPTVVLHNHPERDMPAPLPQAGADHYISLKSEVRELLNLINDIHDRDSK